MRRPLPPLPPLPKLSLLDARGFPSSPLAAAGNASSVRFIRNTPGLVPLAERQASKLRDTVIIERRLVQAIVAPSSPLIGELVNPGRGAGREGGGGKGGEEARKGGRQPDPLLGAALGPLPSSGQPQGTQSSTAP